MNGAQGSVNGVLRSGKGADRRGASVTRGVEVRRASIGTREAEFGGAK